MVCKEQSCCEPRGLVLHCPNRLTSEVARTFTAQNVKDIDYFNFAVVFPELQLGSSRDSASGPPTGKTRSFLFKRVFFGW